MHPATCRGHLIRTYTTIIDEGSILLIRSYFSAKCFFFRGLLPKWGKADMLHTCRHSICDSAVSNQAKEEILYGPAVCERASSIVSPFATKSWNSTLSSSSSSSSSSSDIIIIIIGHKVGGGLRTEEEGISFQVSNINSQQPLPPKLIRNHMSKNIQLEYYHQSQVFKECNQGDINCSSLPAMMDLVEVENLRGNNSESAWEESPQFMSPWVSQSFDHLNVTWPKPAYGRQGLD